MGAQVPPYVFEIVVPREEVTRARGDLQRLAARVRADLPDAAVVLVSAALGVSVWSAGGEALDLDGLPWTTVDDLVGFLGTGCWVLPGPGVRGSDVKAAWAAKRQS